jgi:hypothetical protein
MTSPFPFLHRGERSTATAASGGSSRTILRAEVSFDPRRPGDLRHDLGNLNDPRMPERVMSLGKVKVVANSYVIELHPDDFEDAFLDSLGPDLSEQLADWIAAAVDARRADNFDCFPLRGAEGCSEMPTARKVTVEFARNEQLNRGTAWVRWQHSKSTAAPATTFGDGPATDHPAEPSPTPQPGQFSLELLSGSGPCDRMDLDDPVIAIRRKERASEAPERDADGTRVFWIEHPRVSRSHAQLRLAAGGYVISDQHSLNGTRVNGIRLAELQEQPLRPGDRIELAGEVCLRYVGCSESPLPEPRYEGAPRTESPRTESPLTSV